MPFSGATISLVIGILAVSACPVFFFFRQKLLQVNANFDRSHLLPGTVINVESTMRGTGVFPTVEYMVGNKKSRFRDNMAICGLEIGDDVLVDGGPGITARVYRNNHLKVQNMFATWAVLSGLIGTGSLCYHFFAT